MSRGPGRWQREILVMLERYPAFYLQDLRSAAARADAGATGRAGRPPRAYFVAFCGFWRILLRRISKFPGNSGFAWVIQ
jgi:hypothetical protein